MSKATPGNSPGAQATPSGLVTKPCQRIARNLVPDQKTISNASSVSSRWVQLTPSGLDTILAPPTATNSVPDQATSLSVSVVPEAREVHVVPSGLVRMRPDRPTTTN